MNAEEDTAANVLAGMNKAIAAEGKASKPGNRQRTAGRKEPKKAKLAFPAAPRVIQKVHRPKTHANHSYRDFSEVPPTEDHVEPDKIEEMSFAQKVHHLLSQKDYDKWIRWMPHGRAFKILVPKRLEQSGVFNKYFGHGRYSSFLRQLNNFGFKHLTTGPDRNTYYHEFMLRSLPHLAIYMPPSRNARRLIPDPDNEPDLYAISEQFPVPGAPEDDHSDVPVEEGRFPVPVTPTDEDRPAKIPRMVVATSTAATVVALPAMDVSQARAALALQQQLKMQHEMAALAHLQRIHDQRRQKEATAATVAAYAQLLQNTTLNNQWKLS